MKCANKDCENGVREGYKYCADCYAKWKDSNPFKKSNEWSDNPTVDMMMKINANLGNIALTLDKIYGVLDDMPKKKR